MDFLRFTGELFIYYVLIALGGGVLIAMTFALFQAIGLDVEPLVESWILPCGAVGATVVATWLVEAKQSVIENTAPAGLLDWIQLTLVGTALLVDVLALWAIGARNSDFGFTPNRLAALGMNVVLLVNLAGSAVLYVRFLRGGAGFPRLWDWQMTYLYVIAGWAAVVAFLFPPLFGFA